MRKLLLSFLFALLITSQSTAQDRLMFDPVKGNDLTRLVVHIEGAKTTSQIVTDIHLDIESWKGSVLDKLKAPNKPGRDPWVRGFRTSLQIVSGGKLYRNAGGDCSAWENDIAVCTVECDGGHFLLHRDLGKKFHTLNVILRPLPELFEEGDKTAEIRIGECGGGEEEPFAVMLDVKSGKKAQLSFSRWAN